MNADSETLKLLLVCDDAERSASLKLLFRQHGLIGELQRIDAGRAAVAGARAAAVIGPGQRPDLVLLDFAAPDRTMLSIAGKLGVGQGRLTTPLVLLTTEKSEAELRSGALDFDESRIFAPTDLECFAENLATQPRPRVLRALAILAGLGPILVRLPKSLGPTRVRRTALSA